MVGGGALLCCAGGGVVSGGGVAGAAGSGVVTLGVGGWSAGRLLQPPSKATDMAAPSNSREVLVREVIIFSFQLREKIRPLRRPAVPSMLVIIE